ncbi:hypothetical protein ACJJTC_015456 [Scirpophaga incertulas]
MSGNNREYRSSNFCKEETNKLIMLLKDFPIITCKKTDHSSNKQKDVAWKKLAEIFNADATKYRSIKQLQQKYNNIKKTARKEIASEKYGRRQTGGGPPPPKPSEASEWLNSIMKESISGLTSVYDSDALENTNLVNDTQDASSSARVNLDFLDTCEENTPQSNVFDTSTPKTMLRKPVSKELVYCDKKRSSAFTPLETRKQIILHTSKKNELLSHKQARELELMKYAK